jgi:hypothetical protein
VHRDCYTTAATARAGADGTWGGPRGPGVRTGDDAPVGANLRVLTRTV